MTTPPQSPYDQPNAWGAADSGAWTAPRHGGDYATTPPVVPGPREPYTLANLMPSPTPPAQPPNKAIAWTVMGAGVAIVLGSFLPWASVTVPIAGTVTKAGTDGTDGWFTAAAGALIALYAFTTTRRRLPNWVSGLAVLAGFGVTGLAVWTIVDLRSRVAEARAGMLAEDNVFTSALAGAVQARVGVGLWLLIAAGLVTAGAVCYSLLKRP